MFRTQRAPRSSFEVLADTDNANGGEVVGDGDRVDMAPGPHWALLVQPDHLDAPELRELASTLSDHAVAVTREALCSLAREIQRRIESVHAAALAVTDDVAAVTAHGISAPGDIPVAPMGSGDVESDSDLAFALVEHTRGVAAAKVTALELEATAVDALLEDLDRLCGNAVGLASTPVDELELASALHCIEALRFLIGRAGALQLRPLESATLLFIPGDSQPAAGSNRLGRILAPPPISASAVYVEGLCGCLLPGRSAKFALVLSASYDCGGSVAAVEEAVSDLLRVSSVRAALSTRSRRPYATPGDVPPSESVSPEMLRVKRAKFVDARRILFWIDVPGDARCGSTVTVSARVAGSLLEGLPQTLVVGRAEPRPAFRPAPGPLPQCHGHRENDPCGVIGIPAVGLRGVLYVPVAHPTMGSMLAVYSARGASLEPFSVSGLDPPLNAIAVATVSAPDTLYVLDARHCTVSWRVMHRIIAIDSPSKRIKWVVEGDPLCNLAALPDVVFAVRQATCELVAFSATDGSVICAESRPAGVLSLIFSGVILTDPATSLVVAEAMGSLAIIEHEAGQFSDQLSVVVCLYRWIEGRFVFLHCARASQAQSVRATPPYGTHRLVYTIVPPMPGDLAGHLVVSSSEGHDENCTWYTGDGSISLEGVDAAVLSRGRAANDADGAWREDGPADGPAPEEGAQAEEQWRPVEQEVDPAQQIAAAREDAVPGERLVAEAVVSDAGRPVPAELCQPADQVSHILLLPSSRARRASTAACLLTVDRLR